MSDIQDHKLDPWEWELVGKYSVVGPTNDYDAYVAYPDLRWIYDRKKLSGFLGYNPEPLAETVVKPRINLNGLGRGVRYASGSTEIEPGEAVQPFFEGRHVSVDIGPKTFRVYQGRKLYGEFTLWHRTEIRDSEIDALHRLYGKIPEGVVLNVEMIGGNIIEAHLRPSIQFISDPEYSLVVRDVHVSADRLHIPWRPPSIHDILLPLEDYDSRSIIVNGDDLRECRDMALILMT